jgi:hypothetical protein
MIPNGRLSLARLLQPLRWYTIRLVGVGLVACLIILLAGMGLYPFESTVDLPESFSPISTGLSIPFSLILVMLVGLGLVSGALFYASYQPGWTYSFFTRFIIGMVGVALPLYYLDNSRPDPSPGAAGGLTQFPLKIQFVFYFLALGCAVAGLICAFISSPRIARWAARFSTGTYLWMALVFLMYKIYWDFLIPVDQINPQSIFEIYQPIIKFIFYMNPFVLILGVIFFLASDCGSKAIFPQYWIVGCGSVPAHSIPVSSFTCGKSDFIVVGLLGCTTQPSGLNLGSQQPGWTAGMGISCFLCYRIWVVAGPLTETS